jgi:ankyrin repeat protein
MAPDKRTPLHLAASEGHLECVELLLSYWSDVNSIDRMGGTALSDAVRYVHYILAEPLTGAVK